MSKKVPVYILIIVIIVSGIFIYGYHRKVSTIEKDIDYLFSMSLESSLIYLDMMNNDSIGDENDKVFCYLQTTSNLKVARDLALMTSYSDKNKYLVTSINNLYLCMLDYESREMIVAKREKFYKYLFDVCNNPRDIEKSKILEKEAGEIYFDTRRK